MIRFGVIALCNLNFMFAIKVHRLINQRLVFCSNWMNTPVLWFATFKPIELMVFWLDAEFLLKCNSVSTTNWCGAVNFGTYIVVYCKLYHINSQFYWFWEFPKVNPYESLKQIKNCVTNLHTYNRSSGSFIIDSIRLNDVSKKKVRPNPHYSEYSAEKNKIKITTVISVQIHTHRSILLWLNQINEWIKKHRTVNEIHFRIYYFNVFSYERGGGGNGGQAATWIYIHRMQ